jgi:hypothetical protein
MWLWLDANFTPQQARARLCGFLHCLVFSPNDPSPDLRKLMERIEENMHSARKADRPAMFALYWLFNNIIAEEYRRPNWLAFLSRYKAVANKCSIELVTTWVVTGQPVPWPCEVIVPVVEQYLKTRYTPAAARLPLPVEIGLFCHVANLFLAANNREEYDKWVYRAILEAAGRKATQENLRQAMENSQPVDIKSVVGWPPVSAEAEQPMEAAERQGEDHQGGSEPAEEQTKGGQGARHRSPLADGNRQGQP